MGIFINKLNLPKNILKLLVTDIKKFNIGFKHGKINEIKINGYKNKLTQGTKIILIRIESKFTSKFTKAVTGKLNKKVIILNFSSFIK